jgi:hypothetical protein
MKKIATNTLATLVLIGVMSLTSVSSTSFAKSGTAAEPKQLKRLERVYQRHDRKHELRASVLGISAEDLREQLKHRSLETIVKKHGFKDRLTYYTAVTGKLKDELRKRGWSERKIENQVQKRVARLASGLALRPVFSV